MRPGTTLVIALLLGGLLLAGALQLFFFTSH
jgi:Tfp pilus assembly protein PilW